MTFLNPSSSKLTSYVPTGRAGIRQSPWPPLTVVCVKPVCSFFAVTVTPGSTPPLGSEIVPVNVPVGLLWATNGADHMRHCRNQDGKYQTTHETHR